MFEKNDRVVDSGTRAGDNDEHCHDTTEVMRQWTEAGTVLTVRSVDEGGDTINAGTPRITHAYHPSELRYATPGELAPTLTLKRGSIVRLKDGHVGFVGRAKPDSDGDLLAEFLDPARSDYFKSGEIAAVLGDLESDGFVPRDGDKPGVGWRLGGAGPETWKKGDRVVCTPDQFRWITEDNEYTLLENVYTAGNALRVALCDDAGHLARYGAEHFRLVRRAAKAKTNNQKE